ncbi:MAG: hypothetical protein KDD63_08345 [Bacteroidetes bacterium]|nr:hypothetical protein [Bacteroidota bacterium]
MNKIKTDLIAFFTTPVSPIPLGLFRILMSGFVLIQAAFWYPDWHAFLGEEGWIQWEISRALNMDWHIHIQQIHLILQHIGFTASQTVEVFFWVYVICALGLLIGWYTRIWAILTWVCHYILMSSIPTFVYGVDIFLQIGLFYIMIMPVAKAWSVDLLQGRVSGEPTWGVTLSLRVLQIHLCLAYLSAGYEKMRAADWWNGTVLWRSVVQPDFRQFDLTWLAWYPWIPKLLSWFTMIVEAGYCVGMWIPRVRIFWLLGIVSLHIGIILFLGLWLFGTVMIFLSISAFGYAAFQDWQKWRSRKP